MVIPAPAQQDLVVLATNPRRHLGMVLSCSGFHSFSPARCLRRTMDKRTLIIAQILITFMMALSMSGIMSAIGMGLTAEWLHAWPRQFIIAWTVAFILTQATTRVAFPVAFKLRRML